MRGWEKDSIRTIFLHRNARPGYGWIRLEGMRRCSKCGIGWMQAFLAESGRKKRDVLMSQGVLMNRFEAVVVEEGTSRSGAHYSLLSGRARPLAVPLWPTRSLLLLVGDFYALPHGPWLDSLSGDPVAWTVARLHEEGVPSISSGSQELAVYGEIRNEELLWEPALEVAECHACMIARATEEGVPLRKEHPKPIGYVWMADTPWVPLGDPGVIELEPGAPGRMDELPIPMTWERCSVCKFGPEAPLGAPDNLLSAFVRRGGRLTIWSGDERLFHLENNAREEPVILNLLIL